MSKKVPWAQATFCAVLMLYVLYMLHPAFALAQQGSALVSQELNPDASYDAYQVFSASIDDEGRATNLSWATEGVSQVVLGYLDERDYLAWIENKHPGEDQHDLAQNAAEYITTMFGSPDTVAETDADPVTPTGDSFASGLARALVCSELEPTTNVHAGEEFVAEQGYWLLVTNMSSITSSDGAGTAPIWLMIGPSHVDAVEKTSIPTATFAVQEDSTKSWQNVADSNRKQGLPYRVEGTLPDNFEAFDQYHYRFEIRLPDDIELELPEGSTLEQALTIRVGSNVADVDGTNVSASHDGKLLVVDFPNLHSDHWSTYELSSSSSISVEYVAHLSDSAAPGMPGHTTEAILIYTADPISLAESATQAMTVTVFTYELEVLKADSDTGTLLAGAAFSLRVNAEDDAEASDLYVQKDGSLGTTIHTFTTDEHGKLTVSGLDEGAYLLVEEAAPEGYTKITSDMSITIAAHLSPLDRTIEDLTISKGSDAPCEVRDIHPEKGIASLLVTNTRTPQGTPSEPNAERMPQTGVGPTAELLITVGLICVGVSLIRFRRQR